MDQSQQQLLKSSNFISQILDQLKTSLIEQNQSRKQDGIDAVEYIEKAIDLRRVFRFLVDGIQTNRSLVQIQKQQIQRKKMYLQGLHYYKATLKSQITNSQLDVVDMTQYMEQEKQGQMENAQGVSEAKIEKPTQNIDWIDDYSTQEQKLMTTMEQFKQRKQQIKQHQLKKQQLTTKLLQSQQKSTKSLPNQLKKLHQQLQQTTKLFGIKQLETAQLNEFNNKKIQKIFSLLFPLKVKEMIELKHNVVVVAGDQVEEELQVTIEKGWYGEWYEYARKNKIMIEDKQFRFIIAALPSTKNSSQSLAISISRREELSVQQIFNNLLLQQTVKPIYENPRNQSEINTNIKYARLDWIGDILGSNSCMISGKMFIDKVKERVFSLSLVKYALENVTKKIPVYFFPLFKGNQQGSKHTTFPILENKKIIFTKCEKSQFQEYKEEAYIPEWIFKALNNQKILIEELKSQKSKASSNIDFTERKLLSSFIESNNLQDLEEKNAYDYYRFEVTIDKDLLTGFFLIPIDYPKKKSVVKLIGLKKAADSHQLLQISKNSEMLTEKNQNNEIRVYTNDLKTIEDELNKNMKIFFSNSQKNVSQFQRKKQPFFIYFQINRLISLFVEKSFEKS